METPKTLEEIQKLIVAFRDERDWKQFHNPKDSTMALSLEASELMELFLWKDAEGMRRRLSERREDIEDELADVLYWVLLIANDLEIDLGEASVKKLRKNAEKYPVEKVKGRGVKYTEL